MSTLLIILEIIGIVGWLVVFGVMINRGQEGRSTFHFFSLLPQLFFLVQTRSGIPPSGDYVTTTAWMWHLAQWGLLSISAAMAFDKEVCKSMRVVIGTIGTTLRRLSDLA